MNKIQKVAIGLVLPIALLMSGCAVTASNHTDSHASAASQPTSTPSNPTQKKLGEVVTYKDGLSVSVSTPATYVPSNTAMGMTPGYTNLVFNVVITNNSKQSIDVSGFGQLNSNGVKATHIADVANNVGDVPATTLLPAQSITFQDAYSAKDQTDLTYLITPGVLYQQAIFTSK